MTKEERMDELIRQLADEEYNRPPQAPRDELWQRIRAARAADAAGAELEPEEDTRAADTDVLPFRRRAARWGWRALPIAALLLLSFGLGRLSWLYQRPASLATSSPAGSAPAASRPAGQAPAAPAAASSMAEPGAPAEAPAQQAASDPSLARSTPSAERAVAPRYATRSRTNGSSVYRFAAAQTLGQAELLLTSFRAETRARGTVDPQLAEWAGDVLASTRLLLDSPAARDPKTRGLLEDLELVLAQIVQLRNAGPARAGDTELIDHALQQRDVLPRLRTAVPAGATIGT